MAKSILHLQEILVVAQDSGAGNLLRSSVGSQQIEAVADLLGLDHLGPAAPLQLTVWVHNIVKVFMGFEPLQRAAQHGLCLRDRKSTRLNSSHVEISYAVFCLKKKKTIR